VAELIWGINCSFKRKESFYSVANCMDIEPLRVILFCSVFFFYVQYLLTLSFSKPSLFFLSLSVALRVGLDLMVVQRE